MLAPWEENYDKPRQNIKKQRHQFADKGLYSQSYVFFPVAMYGCERWTTWLLGTILDTMMNISVASESSIDTTLGSDHWLYKRINLGGLLVIEHIYKHWISIKLALELLMTTLFV